MKKTMNTGIQKKNSTKQIILPPPLAMMMVSSLILTAAGPALPKMAAGQSRMPMTCK